MDIKYLGHGRYQFVGLSEPGKPKGFRILGKHEGRFLSIFGLAFKENDRWVHKKDFKKYVNRVSVLPKGVDKTSSPHLVFKDLVKTSSRTQVAARKGNPVLESEDPTSSSSSSSNVIPSKTSKTSEKVILGFNEVVNDRIFKNLR